MVVRLCRKRPSAVNLLRAARGNNRHRSDGGACCADFATPIEVAHADRQNPRGPSRFRFALSMAGGAVAGPLEDAQAAYGKSDHATARRLWSASRPGQCRGAVAFG